MFAWRCTSAHLIAAVIVLGALSSCSPERSSSESPGVSLSPVEPAAEPGTNPEAHDPLCASTTSDGAPGARVRIEGALGSGTCFIVDGGAALVRVDADGADEIRIDGVQTDWAPGERLRVDLSEWLLSLPAGAVYDDWERERGSNAMNRRSERRQALNETVEDVRISIERFADGVLLGGGEVRFESPSLVLLPIAGGIQPVRMAGAVSRTIQSGQAECATEPGTWAFASDFIGPGETTFDDQLFTNAVNHPLRELSVIAEVVSATTEVTGVCGPYRSATDTEGSGSTIDRVEVTLEVAAHDPCTGTELARETFTVAGADCPDVVGYADDVFDNALIPSTARIVRWVQELAEQ